MNKACLGWYDQHQYVRFFLPLTNAHLRASIWVKIRYPNRWIMNTYMNNLRHDPKFWPMPICVCLNIGTQQSNSHDFQIRVPLMGILHFKTNPYEPILIVLYIYMCPGQNMVSQSHKENPKTTDMKSRYEWIYDHPQKYWFSFIRVHLTVDSIPLFSKDAIILPSGNFT